MSGMGFKNFREPVVYVINQELRKRDLRNKVSIDTTWNGELVDYPVRLVRDSVTKKVVKCVYGTGSQQWSEEIIRGADGKVSQIKITLPDASIKTIQINRNLDNLVDNVTES